LAAIHIYGTDHIPARDPLTPAIEQNQDKYRNMIERSVVPILEGAMDISSLWQFIGLEAQADIQQSSRPG